LTSSLTRPNRLPLTLRPAPPFGIMVVSPPLSPLQLQQFAPLRPTRASATLSVGLCVWEPTTKARSRWCPGGTAWGPTRGRDASELGRTPPTADPAVGQERRLQISTAPRSEPPANVYAISPIPSLIRARAGAFAQHRCRLHSQSADHPDLGRTRTHRLGKRVGGNPSILRISGSEQARIGACDGT
jgi:hypothetical protein